MRDWHFGVRDALQTTFCPELSSALNTIATTGWPDWLSLTYFFYTIRLMPLYLSWRFDSCIQVFYWQAFLLTSKSLLGYFFYRHLVPVVILESLSYHRKRLPFNFYLLSNFVLSNGERHLYLRVLGTLLSLGMSSWQPTIGLCQLFHM